MARHKTIDKSRWLISQKKLAEYWHGEDILERELDRIRRFYVPVMEKYAGKLSGKACILDVGCGPVCAARFIKQGEKSYLDPLLDDFRRAYPGKLPKKKHLTAPSDCIPEADASFDLVLCIDALDHAMNPELTLHEIERLLKPDGVFILGLIIFPSLIARLYHFLERYAPLFRDDAHPYSYALTGIKKTLERHFEIVAEEHIPEPRISEARMLGRESVFVCRVKHRA